jgi:GNAT superfamily N-acetyltransferase
MTIRTAVVPAAQVLGLRHAVLRPGLPREAAVFPEDGLPDAVHVAAYDGEGTEVLGCGSFFPEPFPHAHDEDLHGTAFRIRGMASDPAARGRGFGAAVLAAGEAEARRRGAEVMWCNGRTVARGFYERHGYGISGREFVIDGVGPHFVFVRTLR